MDVRLYKQPTLLSTDSFCHVHLDPNATSAVTTTSTFSADTRSLADTLTGKIILTEGKDDYVCQYL